MLSRRFSVLMPSSSRQPLWDIFCNVIDNFGDIGVCWRLARQLANEHGFGVRLWVDELGAFQRICPEVDPQLELQNVYGVEVRRWNADFPEVISGDVVIEAFACRLPERFVEAMAACARPPVWVNLDYLSAEAWVSGCHALPSPHPRLPLIKYFFFPGFNATTGGLLRENDLEDRRCVFNASLVQQQNFWRSLGQLPPAGDALTVSLFSYENPAIADLLEIWANGNVPVCCLAPVTRTLSSIEAYIGRSLQVGDVPSRGNLEIRMLPFLAQPDYDLLLWSCDINFVRGEDSFVRAQWAAKPMVWHIYPQDDEAHRIKLGAFLDIYCANLPPTAGTALRSLFQAWNVGNERNIEASRISGDLWTQFVEALPDLRKHTVDWKIKLSKQEDLCSSLVRFCRSKL